VTNKTFLEFKKKTGSLDSALAPNPKRMTMSSILPIRSSNVFTLGTAPIKEEKGLIRTFLNRFFEARPSQQELISKRVLQGEVHVEDPIPLREDIVERLIAFIESKGITQEGIYRVSGLAVDTRKLERSFINLDFDLNWVQNVNTVSSAFKLYFREMQPPLIPHELYHPFLEIVDVKDPLFAARKAISFLEPMNRQVFESLCRHLLRIASQSSVNKMPPSNLAIVIGPTLFRARTEVNPILIVMENEKKCKLMEFILANLDDVFSNEPPVKPRSTSASGFDQSYVVPPQDDFLVEKMFSDVLHLCINGNDFERVQRAQEIQQLFLGDSEGQFLHYMNDTVTNDVLVAAILKMGETLATLDRSGYA